MHDWVANQYTVTLQKKKVALQVGKCSTFRVAYAFGGPQGLSPLVIKQLVC